MFAWRSEDALWESILLFHLVGSRHYTQALSFGSKYLYPLSHPAGQEEEFIGRMWTFVEVSAVAM